MNTNFETVLSAHYLSLYVHTITHNTYTQDLVIGKSRGNLTKGLCE